MYGSIEDRIPADHPLRPVRAIVDEVLREMDAAFDGMYGDEGRPSIPPERLLRALIIQLLYSIRSERMLMEQLAYNLLFRWFVGLNMTDEVWHPTVFTKNRDRLLDNDVARLFFDLVLDAARKRNLLSSEHFTVDGTLVEAWAGQKSFQRKSGNEPPSDGGSNPTVNFHKEKRKNETHASTTDPDARLFKKTRGSEAKLAYLGHVLTENRYGLVVSVRLTTATGTAERDAAVEMLKEVPGGTARLTVGAERVYDTKAVGSGLREWNVTPHVAQNTANRRSAVNGRTTRHQGYAVSQRKRKRVEEVFGWMKTVAMMRKTRHRGPGRVGWVFTLAAAAYNLVRIRNLGFAPA